MVLHTAEYFFFRKIGGLQVVLLCNYDETKLPEKLSQFHQQALQQQNCVGHNFSPHKTIIWSNEYITRKNKSLYLQHWIDRNIIFLADLQHDEA